MPQMTWRTSQELLERVRAQAQSHGRSLNEWVTLVMQAATDPALATSESERVRERLAAAGLLERPVPAGTSRRPSRKALDRARAEAGRGTPLADLVASSRT